MVKYQKEDLAKIIALSVVLCGVVVWIIVGYVQGSRKLQKKMAAAAEAHRKAHAAEVARPGGQTTRRIASARSVAGLMTPVPAPSRDPFRPIIPPRWTATRATASGPANTNREPPAALAALPPLAGGASARATRSRDVLQLSGVILGTPSIAVLRRGDEAYIVRQGDYIEGGLRVETIERTSVTLRDKQQKYVMRIGE